MAIYPNLIVEHPKNPNKFWAVPIVGILVKLIILIPVLIELLLKDANWLSCLSLDGSR